LLVLNRVLWIGAAVFFTLALPPVAAAVSPGWVRSFGLDVWSLPELHEEVAAAAEQSRELQAEDDDIQQRIVVKEALIADLIAGRTTLAEVTAQFLILNKARPEYMAVIRAHFPGSTDQEKVARNVIDYARPRVADPVRREQLVQRLEAELVRMPVAETRAAH
jgi:hypothetical protein